MFNVSVETGKISKERAKSLAKLDKLCFTNEAWSVRNWTTLTTDNFQSVFIMNEGNLVGALAWGWFPVAKTGYLYSFAVRPDHRKLGFGRQLVDIFTWQADHVYQLTSLFAHTRTSNEASQHILQNFGFKPNSFINFYYEDSDAIEWKPQL